MACIVVAPKICVLQWPEHSEEQFAQATAAHKHLGPLAMHVPSYSVDHKAHYTTLLADSANNILADS